MPVDSPETVVLAILTLLLPSGSMCQISPLLLSSLTKISPSG